MIDFKEFKSVSEVAAAFPNEIACMEHLEQIRWNGLVTSPFDPISKVYLCADRKYRCRNTGKYFNVKTGTIFYNSKVPLQKWFMAIWMVTTATQPITSIQLGEDLGLTQKTAWFLLQRIRKHLGLDYQKISDRAKPNPRQKVDQIEVVVEKDRMQLLEWLQTLKK
ncbi:hypothetical protein [Flavobacterium caeni]|uniref:Transposase n=1 Tax=Flavobacterium caeni TaxID=490189 RepID=A0A1G5H3M9_9FLAO|nr:hypothetical protein [Flavobacterium caeni]SCY58334.1 hypothetical protein SAMN02927903_01749 [Flavobacterium caeni]